MKSYIPATREEQTRLLEAIGLSSTEALFRDIPDSVRLRRGLKLPDGLPEADAMRRLRALADQNGADRPLFRGAGAYRHFIPAIIPALVSRGEFLTAYTPYQPEMSQGMLQAIFEYQSLIARLTGLEASNASVYDGATAAAEAMLMCRDSARKDRLLVSEGLHPDVIATLRAYAPGAGVTLTMIPLSDGVTDIEAVCGQAEGAAGLIAASPNYFGCVEDTKALADAIHAANGLMVSYVNPISLGILKKPGALGADIAVGDGQPLGLPMSFGGPSVGFMAATKKLLRNLPGRIVGETADGEGNRAYVLTLQAREQHIRREKATSNICSNQSLCAIQSAIYLTAMGPHGLRDIADACLQKAHFLADRIQKIPGMRLCHDRPFFHEFVIESDVPAARVDAIVRRAGIVGGLPVGKRRILYCVTEMNTRDDINALLRALEVVA